jgi:hypothetical protein
MKRFSLIIVLTVVSWGAWGTKDAEDAKKESETKGKADVLKEVFRPCFARANSITDVDLKAKANQNCEDRLTETLKAIATAGIQLPCDKAAEALSTAVAKFNSSCDTIGTELKASDKLLSGGGTSKSGNPCAMSLARCQDCTNKNSPLSFLGGTGNKLNCALGQAEDDDTEIDADDSATRSDLQEGLERAKLVYAQCMPLAGSQLEKLRKLAADGKKDLRALEKEMDEAQGKKSEAEKSALEDRNKFRDQAEELEDSAKEDMKGIEKALKKTKENFLGKVTQLKADIGQINKKISDMVNLKFEAATKLSDAKATLRGKCHAEALRQVDSVRTQIIKMIETNTYSVSGGFSGMMSTSGSNSKSKFKIMAEKFYQDCIRDSTYADAQNSAKQAYDDTIRRAETEIDTLNGAITGINKEIQEILGQKMVDAHMEATKDLHDLQQKVAKRMSRINERSTAAAQAATVKSQREMAAIQRLGRDITDERSEYEFAKAELFAAKRSAGGSSVSSDKFGTAQGAFASYRSAASHAVVSCCSGTSDGQNCVSACAALQGSHSDQAIEALADYSIIKKGCFDLGAPGRQGTAGTAK